MNTQTLHLEQTLTTLGGRVTCQRCQAKSKRTKLQCAAPAGKGKTKCRFHGGRSTGPRTEAGTARCGAAHLAHGNSTRQARAELSEELVKLALLEELGRRIGLITGPRSKGRRPGNRKA
jgi:hypothetical protein